MASAIKIIVIIIALYLLFGAYLYITSGGSDLMKIILGPAETIGALIRGALQSVGIGF